MANPEHIEILKGDAGAWNAWREADPGIVPDLSSADLHGLSLSERILAGADFTEADLSESDLRSCDLTSTRLIGTRAVQANFSGSTFQWCNGFRADLSRTLMMSCDAPRGNFAEANLTEANLAGSRFNLWDFAGARLTRADLSCAEFVRAHFQGVDFKGSRQGLTIFVDAYLVGTTGLDRCEYGSFNLIDFRTLINSRGQLPLSFLRGCGLPEGVIKQYLRDWKGFSPLASAFVSHSSRDSQLVDRLVDSLHRLGISCYYTRYDMHAGAPVRDTLYQQIDANEFLICLMSEDSLASDWVRDEVQYALSKERELGRRLVIPIRIDEAAMRSKVGWAISLREDRHIEDFRDWEHPLAFDKSLKRLLDSIKSLLPNGPDLTAQGTSANTL